MTWRILEGDALERLRKLDAGSVQTCITSPPYFGLRDYGTAVWEGGDEGCNHSSQSGVSRSSSGLGGATTTQGGAIGRGDCGRCGARRIDSQIGLEPTPDEYVASLVAVFGEVRRVLRDDGTLWLNLGDSYAAHGAGAAGKELAYMDSATQRRARTAPAGTKPKDLLGIPWMVAFALRDAGWYLRNEIIWAKGKEGQAGMPESMGDRCTRSHEQIFLLAKAASYYFDADAIREPSAQDEHNQRHARVYDTPSTARENGQPGNVNNGGIHARPGKGGRNKRTVWNVSLGRSLKTGDGDHYATFPPQLVEPMVLAGSPIDGMVLDPFAGAGTTGLVALRHQRSFIGIELNPAYCALGRNRLRNDQPMFNVPAEVAA